MLFSLKRMTHIISVLAKHRVDTITTQRGWLFPFRMLRCLNPFNWGKRDAHKPGESIRLALQELGPIFVKLGQVLATRKDLIPLDIAEELSLLQDRVKPFDHATDYIQTLYDQPLESLFASIEETPLASASIAQVHAATLHNGDDVIIKAIRPGIEKQIQKDIRVMRFLANTLQYIIPKSKRLRPFDVVSELERTLHEELDLIREGSNASQLKRNFKGEQTVYIPSVYWSLSNTKALVLERIHGIRISDKTQLEAQGFDFKRLAEIGVELFFTQVFRDNFFHADMHPGNIFVKENSAASPQFILVDFGMMGSLSSFDKRYLAQNFYAFIQKDYYRVAELHIASNWVPKDTRIDEFTNAVRAICEPILERPIHEISCAQLLLRLFDVGKQFKMELLPQLLLLQKTLFAVEGLGRDLYPELNIWETAKPFIEEWMKQELGMRGLLKTFKRYLPYWQETLPELPQLLHEVLTHFRAQ